MIAENEAYVPAILTVTGMARLLELSRSRVYQLIDQGVFIAPIYSEGSSKPFYTAEMAKVNLEVKRTHIGVNGRPVMFYASRNNNTSSNSDTTTQANNGCENSQLIHFLKAGLSSLEQKTVSDIQLKLAIDNCFPAGTENIEQGEILKAVFRYLKHQKSTSVEKQTDNKGGDAYEG